VTLTSTSTLSEICAAYDDSVDYDLVGSVDKAKQFIQACRMLLRRLVGDSTQGESRVVHGQNLTEIRQQLARAQQWLDAQSAGARGNVVQASVAEFRSE